MEIFWNIFNAYPWQTVLFIYFLPTILNFFTRKCFFKFIFGYNLWGGWTVIGWFASLFLAIFGIISKEEQEYSMKYRGNHWIRGGKKKKR